MPKIIAFNNVSLDGYFVDENGGMMWAHQRPPDPEFDAFVAGNAGSGGVLLFGRITYQMMAGYWPSPMALQQNPVVAEGMNSTQKIVFSKTLATADWNNTRLISGDLVAEVKKLKEEPGNGMAILGSGTIVAQLAHAALIDEIQMVVNPVILGKGRTMFDGVANRPRLKLIKTRAFPSGLVLLTYSPAQ